jgi:hypothetical protein
MELRDGDVGGLVTQDLADQGGRSVQKEGGDSNLATDRVAAAKGRPEATARGDLQAALEAGYAPAPTPWRQDVPPLAFDLSA